MIIAGLTVLFSLRLTDLKIEDETEMWFSPDDPVLKTYTQFLDEFPSDEFNLIAFKTQPPLDEDDFAYLLELKDMLETIPYVSEVITLANVEDVVGRQESLTIGPLIGEQPLSEKKILWARKRIEINPFIKGVLISADGRHLGVVIQVDRTAGQKEKASDISRTFSDEVQKMLAREEKRTGRSFYFSGTTVLDAEVARIIEKDMNRFMPYTIILIALALFLVFKNVACILLPIICVAISVVWTLGLKGWLGSPISPVSPALFALIGVIGFADSIHIIQQYRLDLARLKDRDEALLSAFEVAGWPCLLTSVTTAIGFGSLLVSHLPIIRQMGIFASFGILTAFLLSLTVVPIGLRLTRVGPRDTKGWVVRSTAKALSWTGKTNIKFPQVIVIFAVTISILAGLGILKIKVHGSLLQYFREDGWVRSGASFMDQNLGGIFNLEVILEGNEYSFRDPSVLKKLEDLETFAKQSPYVSTSQSILDYLRFINMAFHDNDPQYARLPETREEISQLLFIYELAGGEEIQRYQTADGARIRLSLRTAEMGEEERKDLIESIRTYIQKNLPELGFHLTGLTMLFDSVSANLVSTQLESMGLALFIISGLMLFVFGIRTGLISLLPNLFPILIIFGVMGYFGFALNIGTAIIAAIAIGIVVDDTIHYVSHFQAARRNTTDSTEAALAALQDVGSALIFTSIALTFGFGIFLFSEGKILMDFGILSGLGIVTALLGDLFLTPVLLVWLDKPDNGS